jgi:hypothetical protein
MFRRNSTVHDDVVRDADGNPVVDRGGSAEVDTNGDGYGDTRVPAEDVQPRRYNTYGSHAYRGNDTDGDGVPDDVDRNVASRDMPAVAPVGTVPATETVPERAVPSRWAHVSAMATLSLIIGTAAVLATLSGALAPLGVVAGGVAVLLSLLGFSMVRRSGVTGHSIALLGLLFGVASIVVGLLAINGNLPWLAQDTNGVTRLNDWLAAHISWLTNW